jgi:large subunit ribosomal protein L4
MELEVYKIDGSKTAKKVKLDDAIFSIEPNDHAIYLDVKQHLANKRQGTHMAKDRSLVSGSTKKLKRQKGTGGARSGDINSPVFIGGGRAFGPHPRDYSFKLNKKLKTLARKSALSYKAKDNSIMILEDFTFSEVKTKNYIEMMKALNLTGKKTVLVLPQPDANIYLSSRNIENTKVVKASLLNTYEILNAGNILIVESSLEEMNKVLNK